MLLFDAHYNGDMGDLVTESCFQWFFNAGGTIIISVPGTKGARTVTKAGTSTAKTGITTGKTKLGNMEFRNPFGREPVLAMEGGNIPYNVYDGDALKS